MYNLINNCQKLKKWCIILTNERDGEIMQTLDETIMFKLDDLNKKTVRETLEQVYAALEEKGYDPINQIVGFLLSGDPAYIPRHNDARNLIRRHERDEILEKVLTYYITHQDKEL